MRTVEIRHRITHDDFDTYHSVDVLVDGEVVETGSYGGEPEDNTSDRTYAWVSEALVKVARSLGADARVTHE